MIKIRVKERRLGPRFDGGRSPLATDPAVLTVPEPKGGVLDKSEPFNHGAGAGRWSKDIQKDYDNILRGVMSDPLSAWADARLREWGYTAERIKRLDVKQRMKLCDKLVRAGRRAMRDREDHMLEQLVKKPRGYAPGGHVVQHAADVEESTRGGLPQGILLGYARDRSAQEDRSRLHVSLREWANGPLALEHPQGSSFHHLVEYDTRTSEGSYAAKLLASGAPQIFVVERDWARAFAGYDLTEGECPLPFPKCCFEFRISGVRVLAMYDEDVMFCVYGRDGVWVVDDYMYSVSTGRPTAIDTSLDLHEFPRVAKLVRDEVRVACIMVDASVAETEVRRASPRLVERRVAEKKSPPRDHYVIDLKKRHAHAATRSAGGAATGTRAPQRGHFRRGTWVHYSDADSGQVQYVDDGGFWHSRTWRNWHFAGDPNNLIDKEYRL